MSEPTTEAGKRVLQVLDDLYGPGRGHGYIEEHSHMARLEAIAAIEAEARAAVLREVRAEVNALSMPLGSSRTFVQSERDAWNYAIDRRLEADDA